MKESKRESTLQGFSEPDRLCSGSVSLLQEYLRFRLRAIGLGLQICVGIKGLARTRV